MSDKEDLLRTAIAGTAVATVALAALSLVGVAYAETPASSSTSANPVSRTVSVQGVATVSLAQGANAATATAAYREAMAAAVTDAHEKAEFLAGKVGAALGAVESIAEAGGSISCTSGEEGGYAEYEGEQPDFGESTAVRFAAVPPEAASSPAGRPHHHKLKHKRRHKKVVATHAAVTSGPLAPRCTLSTRVAVVYALS
jgi:Protein of unknown function (DUF541)